MSQKVLQIVSSESLFLYSSLAFSELALNKPQKRPHFLTSIIAFACHPPESSFPPSSPRHSSQFSAGCFAPDVSAISCLTQNQIQVFVTVSRSLHGHCLLSILVSAPPLPFCISFPIPLMVSENSLCALCAVVFSLQQPFSFKRPLTYTLTALP